MVHSRCMTNELGVYLTEDEVSMTNKMLEFMQDRTYAMESGSTHLVEVYTGLIALYSVVLECPHMG